jgi:1-aminocyclopropane-1-carboxylate deaminase
MPDKSYLTKIINCEAIIKQPLLLPAFKEKKITADVLRLDLIHPVISGNKYFKLKVAVSNAINDKVKGIISFGGAYSNHLVALAFLCHSIGIPFIGIVRGEEPQQLSPTLQDAINYGMNPIYVSRNDYSHTDMMRSYLDSNYPGFKIIPEGGRSAEGVEGAKQIIGFTDATGYDVIACAVGTGTMMAGILQAVAVGQHVVGISALKLPVPNDVEAFVNDYSAGKSYTMNYNYHFGGYARKTKTLMDFMNLLWQQHQLPTDFVYTAKLVYGISDLARNDYFNAGTRVLIVHSGGLQGNRSLGNSLIF